MLPAQIILQSQAAAEYERRSRTIGRDIGADHAEKSLYDFFRFFAWPVLQPGTEFKDNWHIGAICLPANTLIQTDRGEIEIGKIVLEKLAVNAASYNHQTNRLEFKRVLEFMQSPAQHLYTIKLSNGNTLTITGNHPIFTVGGGYVRADQIRKGDVVLQGVREGILSKPSAAAWWILLNDLFRQIKRKAGALCLSCLRWQEGVGQQKALSNMLCEVEAIGHHCAMQTMWQSNISQPIRLEIKRKKTWSILQPRMLREFLHWKKQPSIHRWKKASAIPSGVSQNAQTSAGSGWESLLSVFFGRQDGYTSRGSKQNQQRAMESGDALQDVPQQAKRNASNNIAVSECHVVEIKRNLRLPEAVYNIEVADNNNYFANGILVHNCEHLEAVKLGQIKKLLINMPFRMLKSSIVSQAFPAWDWINTPSRQFLTASYAKEVATRDAVDSRRIIDSMYYQKAFGSRFSLTSDQNVKSRYENDKRGMRTITSTDGAGTGFGGDIRIVDDPVSAKDADSQLALATSIEWWRGTMATRANDPETGAAIIVHQRLNANDLTGYLLANETGWEHLILPFRYDPVLSKTTKIGFVDPRTVEGELIHPERISETTAKEMEKSLGSYHVQAQLQQNPEPRGGIIFKRNDWKFYRAAPAQFDEIVLSVDCSFKDLQSSDYVAIQAWGRIGANHYLLRRLKEHLGFSATCKTLRSFRTLVCEQFKPAVNAVLVEDKANGTAVIETLGTEIGGIIPITPDGGKVARAYAMQPDQEAGNIWLPDSSICPEIEIYLSELSAFPGVAHDDETDATTQYVNWARARVKSMGLIEYMKAEVAARDASK